MKHIETGLMVDYARGLAGETDRPVLEAHLASGCQSCQRQASVLGRLASAARADLGYAPPPEVVNRAKRIFPSRPPKKESEGSRTILARLVYDSLLDPLPAGVRAKDRPSQALYEAADYAVDLHMSREQVSREHNAPRMVVVGQIADRRQPGRWVADKLVVLMSGREVAAQGLSSEHGEFHLECASTDDLHLQVSVEAETRIEVSLPRAS
jgi:hypothetical protein